ncbi:DUF5723 family protein [Pedobacter metabolipauper]|uniref:DUF5723 domain-containing protein n=1 Tax=Pedobacter metabolipauper TaxID=425513 RepID=A0A4R6SQY9_9SPHI|nr:DUF5723 family protein [Pedobacter metabolipauper]TDQ06456.1 hypothetical protein ATK78_4526 [Pedobacter metabolipauper]
MIRKYLLLCFLVIMAQQLQAQQYGLFNTNTLFDGFENPAQKTFRLDYSRRFSSNFFLPYLGLNATSRGSNDLVRRLASDGVFTARDLPLGTKEMNTAYQNTNVYLFAFKVFQSYKFQKEIGFSWQLRTDAQVDYTNETLAIIDNYRRFEDYYDTDFNDAFNNKGYAQSYHQFSLSYRENLTKKLAFGGKISLLSGITYNQLKITNSNISLASEQGPLSIAVNGSYRTSFKYEDEISKKNFFPNFKNPGIALSFGTSYTSKDGTFIMANIKDLGVIKWAKSSYSATFNNIKSPLVIDNPDLMSSDDLEDEIIDIVTRSEINKSFYTPTNAKIDFLVSKTFDYYTPSLIISKNVLYKGGDVAFVNKFSFNDLSVSAVPTYNLAGIVSFGMQGMYQTPNFEAFLGSDNLFKTVTQTRSAIQQDAAIGKGYNSASIYLGVGIKFGNLVEHPQNSSTMPGIGEEGSSIFKKIFGIFSKKKR